MKPKHAALQQTIGYQFDEPELLVRALTHRSFAVDNNERLEFIGDGLVNAVVAELLFTQFPDLDEGSLSRLRSKLVSKEGLASTFAVRDVRVSGGEAVGTETTACGPRAKRTGA